MQNFILNQKIEEVENTLVYDVSLKTLKKKKFDIKDLKKLEKENDILIKNIFQNSFNTIILENSLILKKVFLEYKSFPNLIKSLIGKNYFDFFSFFFITDENVNLFEFNKNYKKDIIDNKNYFYIKNILDFLEILKNFKKSEKISQLNLEKLFFYENLLIKENSSYFYFLKNYFKNFSFENIIFLTKDLKSLFKYNLSDSQIFLLLKIFEENLLWNLETIELYIFYNNLRNQLLKKKNILKFLTPLNSEFFKSTYYYQNKFNMIFDIKKQLDIFQNLKNKEPLIFIEEKKEKKNLLKKKTIEILTYLTLFFYESKFLMLIKNSKKINLQNELKKKDFINYSKILENYKDYNKYKKNYVK